MLNDFFFLYYWEAVQKTLCIIVVFACDNLSVIRRHIEQIEYTIAG